MLDKFIGQILGDRYEIENLISSGGMGTIYTARDRLLNRQVAVKIIRPEYVWSSELVNAFIQEARIIAKLDHSNILKIHDLGKTENNECPVFLVMQLAIDTLKNRLTSALQLYQAEPILKQICAALDYAHAQDVIHLDLKPSNILFDTQGNALVADFGLAKLLQNATHVKADTNVGTQAYMPPEQFFGGDAGPFSDVYALGMTLHEMLTGEVPKREWAGNLLIIRLAQSLSEGIKTVIATATQLDYRQRYQTAGELYQAFLAAFHPASINLVTPISGSSHSLVADISPPSPPPLPVRRPPNLVKLRDALRDLGQFCENNPDIVEREVVNYTFKIDGLFATLGYDEPIKKVLLEHQQADVVLRAFNGRPLAVIEFKRPNRSPNDGLDQLENHYIARLLPDVGVLCNGRELWIYRRNGIHLYRPPVLRLTCKNATEEDAQAVYNWLSWREIDLVNLEEFGKVLHSLINSPISVRGPAEPGGQAFLDRLALRPSTPFGRLVAAMAAALPDMLQISSFTRGAYAFWKRIYARELARNDAPQTWKALMPDGQDGEEALYYLMFALESAYAVLSRLLLAWAMENHDFPHLELIDTFLSTLKSWRKHGKLDPDAYATALKDLFRYVGQQALQSLFDSDLFDWWHDIGKSPNTALVGERLAEAALTIFEFDFKLMSGDLLGGLYQSYFDPESRKALGEFYTPPEVVDFLLDEVGYTQNDNALRTKRLLDPSCGSGTILVHALQRYLAANQGLSAVEILRDLLGGLKVVGFDINPFAVLMAKANYAAQIIPLYARALKEGGLPPTLSIPVLRTDSLRQEYREGEISEGHPGEIKQGFLISQDEDVTRIRTELPVEISPGEFFHTDIPVPRYDKARSQGWVRNPEDYFSALRVLFDTVDAQENDVRALQRRLQEAGLSKELAEYMQPAVAELIREMQRLREQYEDGRFLRTLADLALALILKNDIWYHYVVGNPPYIRIQSIPQKIRERWEVWYHWAGGNFDAYIPFLERGIFLHSRPGGLNLHEWLYPGGKLGFICSDRFLFDNYAEELREVLPHKAAVELLLDMRDSRVFEDALNYPAILIARRLEGDEAPPKTFSAIRVFADPRQGAGQLLAEARRLLTEIHSGKEYIQGEIADAFLANTNDLRRSAWLLMPPHERSVFEKLETAAVADNANTCPVCKELPAKNQFHHPHTLRLKDLTLTQSGAFQGIATGDDSTLIFRLLEDRGETLLLRPKGADRPDWNGPSEVEIEREVLRPWLFGRDVQRWYIAWDGWYVFFPYAVITALEKHRDIEIPITRYRLIPATESIDIFRKKYKYVGEFPLLDIDCTLAWQYVSHPFIENRLRKRENERYQKEEMDRHLWYGVARPQNLEYVEQNKLVIQIASQSPDMAIDDSQDRGHYVFQAGGRGGGVYGILPRGELVNLALLAALMNTRPLDFYLKHISMVYSGRTYSYSDSYIKQLPIKLPTNEIDQEKAEHIAKLAQELTHLKGSLEAKKHNRDSFPEAQSRSLPTTYDLYPLRQLIQGRPLAQSFKRSEVSFGQQALDGGIAMQFGRTSLILPNQVMVEVVQAWLRLQSRENLRVDDLLSISLPQNLVACQQLLTALHALEKEIDALQTQLIQDEVELNNRVADYYGLDIDDQKVIADFLERF